MYLVIDVGGTFTKFGLLDEQGNILEKGKVASNHNTIPDFKEVLKGIYAQFKDKDLEGVAFSVPGRVNSSKRMIMANGNLRTMKGLDFNEELADVFDGLPIAVENDGKCAGLAEAWIGAAADVENCCVIVFGSAIAGATILGKKILQSSNLIAGEYSYLVTHPDVENAKIHHFGVDYSAVGIAKKGAAILGREELSGEELFDIFTRGENAEINAMMDDFFFNVACQCYNLQTVVDPDIICLGGGISEQPCFLENVQKQITRIFELGKPQFQEPKVAICKFNNDSNLVGALYNFLQHYGKL